MLVQLLNFKNVIDTNHFTVEKGMCLVITSEAKKFWHMSPL